MLIGVDAGTSVVKAVAFAQDGEALATAARPTRTVTPAPGRSEQDLEEIIAAVGAVVREVRERSGTPPEVIGLTAQGDGLWLLDERGRSVRPAILWSDARAARIVEEWETSGVAARMFRRSASVPFSGSAAPLLAYLQAHEPESLRRATTAGCCKDAIAQRLTGVRATDVSDASLPFLDLRTRRYDRALLELCGVGAWQHLLAPIDPPPGPLRAMNEEGAALTGLPVGTPVHAGPFDFPATAIGAGLRQPGDGLVILGTTLGCGALIDRLPTMEDEPAGMTVCLPEADRWVRIMPAMAGMMALEWALALVGERRGALDRLLKESPPGANGVTALPFLSAAGERAPFVDPAARGQLGGLSVEATRADVVRAVCEGIAYAARHCLEAAGLSPVGDLFVCGGGARSPALRQLLAEVLGRSLRLARQPEVGARGAAIAALEARGTRFDRAAWTWPEGVVEPDPRLSDLYEAGFAHYLGRIDAARGRWRGPLGCASSDRP